jgi:hypothetical protein
VRGPAATARPHTHDPQKLEDDAQERLLYHPDRPARAVMLDSLPGAPKVDETGHFKPAGVWTLALILLPLATLVGHGCYLW